SPNASRAEPGPPPGAASPTIGTAPRRDKVLCRPMERLSTRPPGLAYDPKESSIPGGTDRGVRTNAWDDRTGLGKAFSILDAFSPGDRWLRLADITERTGYPKATVHRLTAQLVEWGALQKIDNWLRLGSHLFEVGYMVPHFRLLRESAGPLLVDLHAQTKLTVKLGVLETTE